MLAVLFALTLAAWLPLQAQQATNPQHGAQTQGPEAAQNSAKPPAQHECCCAKDKQVAHNPQAMACCNDVGGAKASCCEGKCCAGMKEGQCPAKEGKPGSQDMDAKKSKGCCAHLPGQCPTHQEAKS
jgi:hypothetical protein